MVEMESAHFRSPAEFRDWLEAHHESADAWWVGYHKRGTGTPSLTRPESVDEALCYGWIDGVRRSVDAERSTIRFTPRRKGSIWSRVNLGRVEVLIAAGWALFVAQSASYRRTAIGWILAAKREETRLRRLEQVVEASAAGRRWIQAAPRGVTR